MPLCLSLVVTEQLCVKFRQGDQTQAASHSKPSLGQSHDSCRVLNLCKGHLQVPCGPLSPDFSQQRVEFQHVLHMLKWGKAANGPESFPASNCHHSDSGCSGLLPHQRVNQDNAFSRLSPPSAFWQVAGN